MIIVSKSSTEISTYHYENTKDVYCQKHNCYGKYVLYDNDKLVRKEVTVKKCTAYENKLNKT